MQSVNKSLQLFTIGLALLTAVSCGVAPGNEKPNAPENSQAAVDLGPPSLGEQDAPVVLTEYSDLQ